MHAGGTRHLRQAADRVFHLVRRGHHQVGKLVDNDDDLRHFVHGLSVFVLIIVRLREGVVAL